MEDIDEKSNRVEKISAKDMQKAFDLGVRLVKSVVPPETAISEYDVSFF